MKLITTTNPLNTARACIAMICNLSIKEIAEELKDDKKVKTRDIIRVLRAYNLKVDDKFSRVTIGWKYHVLRSALNIRIIAKLTGINHHYWVVVYRGEIYDPTRATKPEVIRQFPGRPTSYLEVRRRPLTIISNERIIWRVSE